VHPAINGDEIKKNPPHDYSGGGFFTLRRLLK
jgi:hypothetical protein